MATLAEIRAKLSEQETKQKDYSFDDILFYGIVLLPFIVIMLRVLYEFLFL